MHHIILMAGPGGSAANPIVSFLPLLLIFVVFYFFIIRPQKKKEETRKQMIEGVKKNDRIITIGGVHGTVTQVDDSSVLVQVDSNTKLRVDKNAIASIAVKES
ncbi:MAG TPA: preprotein translocase subunit YajC [Rhodothermales bacterium]|nr:preprotein translocase subunit YajC [Rhodothermales bacterium]